MVLTPKCEILFVAFIASWIFPNFQSTFQISYRRIFSFAYNFEMGEIFLTIKLQGIIRENKAGLIDLFIGLPSLLFSCLSAPRSFFCILFNLLECEEILTAKCIKLHKVIA